MEGYYMCDVCGSIYHNVMMKNCVFQKANALLMFQK